MNEATADNNGVYLLDGRHGNGCRQKEREREGSSPQLCTVWIHAIRYLCKQVAFKNGWIDSGYRDTLWPRMFITQRGILVRMPDAVHFFED